MKHNKFISRTSSVLNLLVKHLSVYTKVERVRINVTWNIKVYQGFSSISKGVKCIKEYHGSSYVLRSKRFQ